MKRLIIFAGIVVLLALFINGAAHGPDRNGMRNQTKTTIRAVEKSSLFFSADHDGIFPVGGQEVWPFLMESSTYKDQHIKPYLEEIPTDSWGNVLNYRYPPQMNHQTPDIWSNGPNGRNDKGRQDSDDIVNWQRD